MTNSDDVASISSPGEVIEVARRLHAEYVAQLRNCDDPECRARLHLVSEDVISDAYAAIHESTVKTHAVLNDMRNELAEVTRSANVTSNRLPRKRFLHEPSVTAPESETSMPN